MHFELFRVICCVLSAEDLHVVWRWPVDMASGHLLPTKVVDLCVSSESVVAEAVCWGRLMVPALIGSLESFAPCICPHERYFANTEQLLKQIRITLALLVL